MEEPLAAWRPFESRQQKRLLPEGTRLIVPVTARGRHWELWPAPS
jgi:hypothetical protein